MVQDVSIHWRNLITYLPKDFLWIMPTHWNLKWYYTIKILIVMGYIRSLLYSSYSLCTYTIQKSLDQSKKGSFDVVNVQIHEYNDIRVLTTQIKNATHITNQFALKHFLILPAVQTITDSVVRFTYIGRVTITFLIHYLWKHSEWLWELLLIATPSFTPTFLFKQCIVYFVL